MPAIHLSPVVRRYLIAAILCVMVASIGVFKRHWETKDVRANLEQALAIESEAGVMNGTLFGKYKESALSKVELAASLEREMIPRWRQCVSLMATCRSQGVKGRVFEDLSSYYSLRLSATELLVEALNENDQQLLDAAESRWVEADQVSERLELRRMMAKSDRFQAPERSQY